MTTSQQYQRNYYLANRDRILARNQAYAQKPKKKKQIKLRMQRYQAQPKHKLKERLRSRARSQTPERFDYIFKRKYGISLEQYNEMLKEQGSGCAICGGNRGKRRLAVDHDHTTGEVRGLLCMLCNLAVGLIEDSPLLLEKTQRYLRKHSQLRLVS